MDRIVCELAVGAGKRLIPVALLGDSITQQAGTYFKNWFGQANNLAGNRHRLLTNAGVGGERTDEIASRVAATLALAPSVMTVLAGTNDIGQTVAVETITANLSGIYDDLQAAGVPFVAFTLTPRDTVSDTFVTPQAAVNDWLRANLESSWSLGRLCDAADAMCAANDVSPADAGYLADSVHLSQSGSELLAATLAPILADLDII